MFRCSYNVKLHLLDVGCFSQIRKSFTRYEKEDDIFLSYFFWKNKIGRRGLDLLLVLIGSVLQYLSNFYPRSMK